MDAHGTDSHECWQDKGLTVYAAREMKKGDTVGFHDAFLIDPPPRGLGFRVYTKP
jgi:hypothetical protein